jgi:predicted small secreted protein
MNSRKIIYLSFALFLLFVFCSGCGETVRGMSKDASRVGRGTKTIFVSDE